MKVRIDIPVDLRLNNRVRFLLSKQNQKEASWETLYSATMASGGEYFADLEPGRYQKTLEATSGQHAFSSTFEITSDGHYIDETGNAYTIAEDGTLIQES